MKFSGTISLSLHQKKKTIDETILRAAIYPTKASDLIFKSMIELSYLVFHLKLTEKELRRMYLYSLFVYKWRDTYPYSGLGKFCGSKPLKDVTEEEIKRINKNNAKHFFFRPIIDPFDLYEELYSEHHIFKHRNTRTMAFFFPLSDDYAAFHRNLLADFVMKSEVNVTKSKKKADVRLNQWCFFSAAVNWLMFKNHDYTCYYGYCDGYLHSWLVHDGEIVEPTPYKNRDEYIGIEIDAKKMLAKFMGSGLMILLKLSIKQRYKFLKYCTKRGRQEMLKMLKRAKSAIDDVKSQEKISV